jgi:thiamine-phosphate pyrophosphorylase
MTRAPRLMLVVATADVEERGAVIEAAIAAGVDAVQLRDRRAGGAALLRAAETLRPATRRHGAVLLVNDRIDVATAAGADGVHLPAASFPIPVARRLLGPDAWIGRSTHAPAEAEAAAAEGADYVVLGPIFATPSKAAYGEPLGVAALRATRASCPVIAIGGLTQENAAQACSAGASGLAVIRAILESPAPAVAARTIADALAHRARQPA